MTIASNAKQYAWGDWLLGVMRSFISGGSAAMVAGLSSMGIAPNQFNLTNSVGNTLKLMGVMFLFQGGYRMFEFLSLHAVPDKLQQVLENAAVVADKNIATAKAVKSAVVQAKETVVQTIQAKGEKL